MYDSREKAIRDRNWELNAARHEGEMKGKIEMIRTLQELLQMPVGEEQVLLA